jgi:hypothetical protein
MRRVQIWYAAVVAGVLLASGSPAVAVSSTLEPTSVSAGVIAGGSPTPAGQAGSVFGYLRASSGPLAGTHVRLLMRPYGSTTFSDVATAVSGPDGRFVLSTPPLWQNTSFQWVYDGDATHAASSSSVWEVPVSARASIRVADHTPAVHQRVVVRGRTFPSRAGRPVAVWTGIRPCWCDGPPYPSDAPRPRKLAHGTVRADGSYRLVIRFSTSGAKRIYVLVGGGDGLVAGASRYRHLQVH